MRRGNRHPHFGVNKRKHRGWLCIKYARDIDIWERGDYQIIHHPSTDMQEENWYIRRKSDHPSVPYPILANERSLRRLVVAMLTLRLEGRL